MTDLKALSNAELEVSTDKAVRIEKEAITNTTRHFQEVYRRRSYLPDYATMFDYLTKKHGYCNTSASLRIGALNLVIQVPMAQTALEHGELSLTAAANIATFLNTEKRSERPYSQNAKIELVEACLNKSTREIQKEFVRRNPEIEKRDKVRHTSETRVRIDVSIDEKILKKLDRLREILSHVNPSMSLGDLIERLAEDGLDKYCPKRKAERASKRAQNKNEATDRAPNEDRVLKKVVISSSDVNDKELFPAQEMDSLTSTASMKRTRYVPAGEKHRVVNDEEGCVHVNTSGVRCGSRKFLQLDHRRPYSHGGANTAENLRWMCAQHNRYRWKSRFH